MLYNILLVLLIIDSLILVLAVLMQAGQGGGLAASFGGVSSSASSFLGSRQTGNLLTKASWWCGGIFLGLSFLLSLASSRSRAPKSVLDQTFQTPAPVSAPAGAANPGVQLAPAGPAGGNAAPNAAAPATQNQQAPATPATKKP
ncbi:MAG TPA: preprotein translocase subunit SecG [Gemmatimonadaceae bacterium]|nr:preprotein translocase subunit SecG [Gemmatimonadaceae bacterium]